MSREVAVASLEEVFMVEKDVAAELETLHWINNGSSAEKLKNTKCDDQNRFRESESWTGHGCSEGHEDNQFSGLICGKG